MPDLQLTVFHRICDCHKHDEEDQRLRESEETGRKERHDDTRPRKRIEDDADQHHRNRAEEKPPAAELHRERREECHGKQADDNIDHAKERELLRVAEHIDEVIEVEIIDDVDPKAIDQVCNRHPKKLIVFQQDGEHILERCLRLVLAQCGGLLLRPEAENHRAERCNAAADHCKGEPARPVACTAIFIQREVEDDRHDNRRNHLRAEHRADTCIRRRDLALMRVERERGDHRPNRNILCRVEHIHDEIDEGKEHEVEHRV